MARYDNVLTGMRRIGTRLRSTRRSRTVEDSRMPLVEHLQELRARLLKALIVVAVVTLVIGIWGYSAVFHVLREPYCSLPPEKRTGGIGCSLIFTHPTDAFFIRLKVSLIAGVVASCPFWLYQLWAFITPGLHRHERRWAIAFVGSAATLFAAGAAVAYFVLGAALRVLLGFAGDGVTPLLEVTKYLSFVISLLVIFGIAFEFPLVIVMLNLAGIVSAARLRRSRRMIVFLLFAFAAVATPTQDPFSMLAMAVPLWVLFEGSVVFARWNDRRRARREQESELHDDEASPLDLADPSTDDQPSEPLAGTGAGRWDTDST